MNNDIDILNLVTAFGHRWRTWLASSVLVGLLAILFSTFVLPKEYRSSAIVLPPESSASAGVMGLIGGIGAATTLEVNSIGGRELITLLNTRTIRVALIEEFDLLKRYDDETLYEALRRMQDYLLIEEEVEGGLAIMTIVSVKISVWDEDPEFAANMVNWLVDEADRRVRDISLSKANWDRDYMSAKLAETTAAHLAAQTALEEFAVQTGMFALEEQLGQMALALSEQGAQIMALEIEERSAATRYSAEHPIRRELSRRILAARSTVEDLRSSGAGGLLPALDRLPEAQREYFELFLEAKIQLEMLEQLTTRLEMARMQSDYDRVRLRVLQRAVAPDYKDRPKRAWVVLGICVIYQLLWFAWFLFGERMRAIEEDDPAHYARIRSAKRAFSQRSSS